MNYTTNLNLKKPEGTENAMVGDLNDNFETLDQVITIIKYTDSKQSPPANPTEGMVWLCPAEE